MQKASRRNSQSAMEYLMTYGWAILIIAVILAILYQLGIFGGTSFASTGCLAEPGYTCQNLVMNTLGYLTVTLGQISAQTITITELGCSNDQTEPAMVSLSTPIVLTSGELNSTVFQCPISSSTLGTYFTGYLWIGYTTSTEPSALVAQIATLTVQSSTTRSAGPPPPPPSVTVFASGQNGPWHIISSGTSVYWTDIYGGTIMSCSASSSSCASPTTVVSGRDQPYDLAVSGSNIYWTEPGAANVMACPISSCSSPTTLASEQNADNLALSGGNVFWTNLYQSYPSYKYDIDECSEAGCSDSPTVLVNYNGYAQGIAADSTNVYWTDIEYGTIYYCAISSCSGMSLNPSQNDPFYIVVSGSSIYWVDNSGGTVMTCPISSCSSPTTLASGQSSPVSLAVSGGAVYWVDSGSGNVMTCTIASCSGTINAIATGQSSPEGITVSGSSVFWTDSGSGDVMRYGS